jgi:YCII-related domain
VPHYVFTYQQPKGYVPGTDADAMGAWQSYFEEIADHVVDPGKPVFERRAVGEVGAATQLGGYTVVDAANIDEAVALAKACPTLKHGGGVQVGELIDLPDDHIASQLAAKVAHR